MLSPLGIPSNSADRLAKRVSLAERFLAMGGDAHLLRRLEPHALERRAAATIRRIAHELCDASRAAVYGRIGTCVTRFGTVNSWLVDLINVLTGNLDREGGAIWASSATGLASAASRTRSTRWWPSPMRTSRSPSSATA